MKCTRCVAILLGLAISLAGIFPPTRALAAQTPPVEQTMADDLFALGLFRGVGETDDGTVAYDLARVPTRAEALVMLVRFLGSEDDALRENAKHPFNDVPKWAGAYVGYAYEKGLTKGVSATAFNADALVTSSMYLTYMLRALGYQDGVYRYDDEVQPDFPWENPEPLAVQCGLLPISVNIDNFTRADAVQVSYAALLAHQKGSQTTLGEKLVQQGVFTQTQYETTIDQTVFAESQAVQQALRETILHECQKENREYPYYYPEYDPSLDYEAVAFSPLQYAREGDQWDICLSMRYLGYRYDSHGQPKEQVSRDRACRITLSKNAGEGFTAKTYQTAGSWEDIKKLLPTEAYDKLTHYESSFYSGLTLACLTQGVEARMLGQSNLPEPGTHDGALADLRSRGNGHHVEKELSTQYGTIVISWFENGAHTPSYSLFFVPNAACALGEGDYITLPVNQTAYASDGEPETMQLDEAGGTLTYTYSQLYEYEPIEQVYVLHTDKIYTYTLHLPTGEVTTTITDAPAGSTT